MIRKILHAVTLPAALLLAASAGFSQSAEDLRLTVGKSVVIDYPSDVRQISTSNPEIIDASPVTTREILVHGKGLGSATMVIWSKTGQRTFYNVTVDLNVDPLKRLLRESFPTETIEVRTSRDSISLNGKVSNQNVADRAGALAATFAETVVSNLRLSSGQVESQILLRVKFAELDRQKSLSFGINLFGLAGQNIIGTTTGQFGAPVLNAISGFNASGGSVGQSAGSAGAGSSSGQSTSSSGANPGVATLAISQALNLFAFNPKLNLGAFIKALQQEQVLQILAEPNLVTTNGREASFLVGGEFPVPVLQGGSNSGAVTIQFREFGIRLKFTPQMTDNKTIKLHLQQEVSTIDIANGVTLNGFTIPALSTKRAETQVELQEGQSFIVAGLVDNRDTESFSKIPVLGSLPIFGTLFKSRTDTKSRQELVMMVTPEITEPLGPNDPKPSIYMPNDFLVRLDPKDIHPVAKKPATKKK